ncbi:MAG: L-threonylcarbamoyladenylate synthase [bacterium]
MTTEIIKLDNDSIDSEILNSILEGYPIAFPTETVYGLGTPISNIRGVKEIFRIKGREQTKPLAAHISNIEQVTGLSNDIPHDFFILAQHFLPGPLALIIKKSNKVDNAITCGFDTISIRWPDSVVACDLIDLIGQPVAATSANLSGNAPCTSAEAVYKELNGKIKYIIDDGITYYQKESTIVSLMDGSVKLLRQGVIPKIVIEAVLNKIISSLNNY